MPSSFSTCAPRGTTKKEARRSLESGRASVNEDKRIVPQEEWERGCWAIPAAFAVVTVLYVLIELTATAFR